MVGERCALVRRARRAQASGVHQGARTGTLVDQSIDDAVRCSPAWREKEELLAAMPGVGPVIARTLIA